LSRLAILPDRHKLERHLTRMPGVIGEKDSRHPAAADLAHDVVRTDPLKDGGHRRPLPERAGIGGCSTGGFTNQLSRTMAARIKPGASREWGPHPLKGLLVNTG